MMELGGVLKQGGIATTRAHSNGMLAALVWTCAPTKHLPNTKVPSPGLQRPRRASTDMQSMQAAMWQGVRAAIPSRYPQNS